METELFDAEALYAALSTLIALREADDAEQMWYCCIQNVVVVLLYMFNTSSK